MILTIEHLIELLQKYPKDTIIQIESSNGEYNSCHINSVYEQIQGQDNVLILGTQES